MPAENNVRVWKEEKCARAEAFNPSRGWESAPGRRSVVCVFVCVLHFRTVRARAPALTPRTGVTAPNTKKHGNHVKHVLQQSRTQS